ncbi:TPM domain-containing protein [Corynebacterium fournieri]|nr:TPM domain-containing protein [Corynebacterium fournieri]
MTSRYLRILAVSGGLFVATAPALSFATEAPPAQLQAQATATKASLEPGRLTQPVTDDAAVLSADELSEIEAAIQQVSRTKGKSVRVVFLRTFGQYTPSEWVDKAVAANGSNTAVLAISPDERLYNVGGGEEWTQSEIDRMNEAAHAQLAEMNWFSAALNAVNAVGSSGGASSGDGSGAGWVAGGLGVAALAG